MMKLPNVSRKMNCLVLKMTISSRVNDLSSRVMAIQKACQELRESPKFALLLESILMLGNYLNNEGEDANRIKIIKGFNFDSFVSLSGTKGYDKKTSLFDYLEKVLSLKLPEVYTVAEELPDLKAASFESFDTIRQEEDKLSKQLKDVTDELNSSKSLLGAGHVLEEDKKDVEDSIQELEEFASVAQATITKLHRTVEDARTAYSNVLVYFCQDSSLKSEDFFAFVINFLDALESTHRAQEEKREREKNKKKKGEEMTAIKKRVVKEEKEVGKSVADKEVGKSVAEKDAGKSATEKEEKPVAEEEKPTEKDSAKSEEQVTGSQTESVRTNSQPENAQTENTPTASQTRSVQTDPKTISVESDEHLSSLFDQNMPN